MKEDISKALRTMSSSDKKELYASYTTVDNKFCDVENILLYNIGSGAFTNICVSAFCIERGYGNVPNPQMPHQYKYELVDTADFVIHRPLKPFAEWKGNVLSANDIKVSNLKASFFWNYIKKSDVKVFDNEYTDNEKYGIEISIEAPHIINLTSIIKPLLDGVICAFHQQDEKIFMTDKTLLKRLSNEIGEKNSIKEYLLDNKFNIFGKCDLVKSYRNGIKWNPADHLCDAIKLRTSPGKSWKIDGRIFSITK